MTEKEFKKYSRYFHYQEFDSPDAPRSGLHMQKTHMDKLYKARHFSLVPYRVNSGFRTPARNLQVNGKKSSEHKDGYASDLGFKNGHERYRIIYGAICAGFTRIGIYDTFIHLGNSPNKVQETAW